MKRLSFLVLAALVLFLNLSLRPLEGQDRQVLMIVKDAPSQDLALALEKEVSVMRNMLRGAGFQVVIASPSGTPLSAGGITVTPDLTLTEVQVADFDGFILPCMAAQDVSLPGLGPMLREALASGKPVAAQSGSVVTLAKAGILSGRKFAYPEAWVAEVPEFGESIHAGEGIVEDGALITSAVSPYAAETLQAEDGTQALTGALIKQLW